MSLPSDVVALGFFNAMALASIPPPSPGAARRRLPLFVPPSLTSRNFAQIDVTTLEAVARVSPPLPTRLQSLVQNLEVRYKATIVVPPML